MARRMILLACFLFLTACEGCMQTIPTEDLLTKTATTLAASTATPTPTTMVAPSTTTPAQPCVVNTIPFGTQIPAAGSTVPDGTIVGLTCGTSYHASITRAVRVCRNGVLSPTGLKCIVNTCPDYMPLLQPGDGLPVGTAVYITWFQTPSVPVPAPIGTTVTIRCADSTFDTVALARYDNPRIEACQNADNGGPPLTSENFALTCDPTGFWKVTTIYGGGGPPYVPYSGIVSVPGQLYCNQGVNFPPTCINPTPLITY